VIVISSNANVTTLQLFRNGSKIKRKQLSRQTEKQPSKQPQHPIQMKSTNLTDDYIERNVPVPGLYISFSFRVIDFES
jgi:hypothetical protein